MGELYITPVLPSGAEAVDVLRPRHSSISKTVSGSVVADLFYVGKAFCRRGGTFHFTASGNDGFCHSCELSRGYRY